jgi:hypothetical protein
MYTFSTCLVLEPGVPVALSVAPLTAFGVRPAAVDDAVLVLIGVGVRK